MSRLARELSIEHAIVVQHLGNVVNELKRPETWTPGMLKTDSLDGQLLKLYLQNEHAIDWLLYLSPIELFRAHLVEKLPGLESNDDAYVYGRVWVKYRLPAGLELPALDGKWPLFVRVRHLNPHFAGQPELRLTCVWRPQCVPESERQRVCDRVAVSAQNALGTAEHKRGVILFDERCDGVHAAAARLVELLRPLQSVLSDGI
jgi:hypothetical protein